MPWVRFDDAFPVHRKVDGLSDTAFRLHVSAIFWCARNLTDGAVPEEDLELVTARVRAPARFATELVRRGLWHEAGHECDSPHCPPAVKSGWVIHDYLEFQPSKEKVAVQRVAKAERQARWLAKQAGRRGADPPENGHDSPISDPSEDATRDASQDDAPPRPAPKEAGRSPERPPPSAGRTANGGGRAKTNPRGSPRGPDDNPDWRSLPAYGAEREDDQVERAKRGLAALRAQIRTAPPPAEGGP